MKNDSLRLFRMLIFPADTNIFKKPIDKPCPIVYNKAINKMYKKHPLRYRPPVPRSGKFIMKGK